MAVGGAERAIFQLIRGLRVFNVESDLLTTGGKDGYYSQKVNAEGVNVINLSMSHSFDFSKGREFINNINKYDKLHFHVPSPLLMYLASRYGKCRLYYTHRAGSFKYPLKRLISYKVSGLFLKRAFSGISGNTKHAARVASGLFHIPYENICVTYNGIDFSLLNPNRNKLYVLDELRSVAHNVIRIGTSANLRTWKRIDYLINAVSEIKDLPVHCIIIGDGPDRSRLEKLTSDLGLTNVVSFIGKKKEIANYLQLLDVFVLPSTEAESFGNSAVEAMGLGIPTVIMSDGGGLLEHITEDTGFVAKTYIDLPEIIRKLCESESLRKRVGEKGKLHVRQKYSIENMVQGYKNFYHSNH